jgi:hypothetical protein
MNASSFETYKPKPNEFAVAQSRSANPFKLYVPAPHPFAERLKEHQAVPSLWTPGTLALGK